MTVVGTRPEVIKLSRVIAELDERVSHVLVHTGQNYDYELNQVFFDELGLRAPNHFLGAVGRTASETVGRVISLADAAIEEEAPNALLVLGDTNSCLAVYAAKRHKVPVFHMEAGNRCFDQRVPEEINRKVVDHLSDINLTYTDHARRYLLTEGLDPETIIKTGSPMGEVLEHYRPKIDSSISLRQLGLQRGQYFLASAHREENVDEPERLNALLESLNTLVEHYQLPVVYSLHPRTREKLRGNTRVQLHPHIRLLKPLGFFDWVHLQMNAFCVLSDSGTLSEEASLLGFPAVMLRQTHERPEGMDEATVVMAGLQSERILEAVDLVTTQMAGRERVTRIVPDYAATNVSVKVVRIIISYIDYVNRTVWKKYGSGR